MLDLFFHSCLDDPFPRVLGISDSLNQPKSAHFSENVVAVVFVAQHRRCFFVSASNGDHARSPERKAEMPPPIWKGTSACDSSPGRTHEGEVRRSPARVSREGKGIKNPEAKWFGFGFSGLFIRPSFPSGAGFAKFRASARTARCGSPRYIFLHLSYKS